MSRWAGAKALLRRGGHLYAWRVLPCCHTGPLWMHPQASLHRTVRVASTNREHRPRLCIITLAKLAA